MLTKVREYIERNNLLDRRHPVIVGVSGGADSIALLTILNELGYCCIAAHCNFHLRGEESTRDEAFTSEYANRLNVPFIKVDFDTTAYASANKVSIEMAARQLRYDWFEKIRIEHFAQAIAVAHHKDDSVETLIMNLIRGSGIRGLVGIRAKNNYIVRPMLSVDREEIVDWLSENNIKYITDSTNLSDIYTRNFIRLRIIPLLRDLNPSVKTTMLRSAAHLESALKIYETVVEDAKNNVFDDEGSVLIDKLCSYPEPQTILYEILQSYNYSRLITEEVFQSLNSISGKKFYSSTHQLIKDRNKLVISKREIQNDSIYLIPDLGKWSGPIELSLTEVVINSEFVIKKDSDIAYFDADKITFPLELRRWKEGDWFIPFGMKGRKKLSDFFINQKLNLNQKENVWLLCSAENIIWIVGERADNRFRITQTTKKVLIVKFLPIK